LVKEIVLLRTCLVVQIYKGFVRSKIKRANFNIENSERKSGVSAVQYLAHEKPNYRCLICTEIIELTIEKEHGISTERAWNEYVHGRQERRT
jgi:hypothetical protein